MSVGEAAVGNPNLGRVGFLAFLALVATSCTPSAVAELPTSTATAHDAPAAAPAAEHEAPETTATAEYRAPTAGFVAASGGPGFGCGIRAGGHVQCWGSAPTPPPGEFSAVGVGGPSCGVRVDGSMACWGWRRARSEADEKLPWPPPGEFAALSSGIPKCGLRPDGSLACSVSTWGEDDDPTPDGAFVEVSVGADYACGVRPSLSLECWGSNLTPVWNGDQIHGYADVGMARPPEGAFTAVAAGQWHACALDIAGEVVCWGSNWSSQLVGVPEGRFAAVIAGSDSTCALRSDGSAVCWGAAGEIEAATPEGRFVAISEGQSGFCGVRPDGDIECWRSRSRGWQGCLWLVLSLSPFEQSGCMVDNPGLGHGGVRVLPPEGDYVAVSARKGHTCGLLISGEARCWGLFFAGEAEPVAGPFTAISAGWFHACGLRPDGAVACWGNDDAWAQASPPGPFASLSAGWEYTCGLRPDGAVACWARQPGCAAWALIRRSGNDPRHPIECWWDRIGSPATDAPAGSFTAVAAGAGHACALRAADGGVVCWGDNRFGQTEAPAGEFTTLSAAFAHTCGLRPDDSATCWGNNNTGQATPPPGEFTEITAGEWHTCGLRPGGDAECWGQYTIATKRWDELVTPWAIRHTMAWKDARPTPPPGPYTTLTAGNAHTCAIRADRSVDCWGH